MSEFGIAWGGDCGHESGRNAAASEPVTVTASASANTKGSWTQLIAATAFEATAIAVDLMCDSGGLARRLVDIGIGAAASEVVKIPNLFTNGSQSDQGGARYVFPIQIPTGTRIAARTQASTGSVVTKVGVDLLGRGLHTPAPLAGVTDIGTATSDSGGTQIDPGGSANTKGAYTQLIASTARAYKGLLVAAGKDGTLSGTVDTNWLIDIAMGAASSEQVIVSNFHQWQEFNSDQPSPNASIFYPVSVPSGVRLAARAACNITGSTNRLIDCMVYGVF